MRKVAAIHDLSCYGRCSLAVILPVLSVMGVQCCPLPGTVLAWVFWALGIASILPLLVFSIKATDREAAKAGKPGPEASQKAPAHDPLRAAFVFDDEEEEEGTDSADAASNDGKQA